MARGERFTVILDKKIRQDLELVAVQEDTTASKFVRKLIESGIKRTLKKDKSL